MWITLFLKILLLLTIGIYANIDDNIDEEFSDEFNFNNVFISDYYKDDEPVTKPTLFENELESNIKIKKTTERIKQKNSVIAKISNDANGSKKQNKQTTKNPVNINSITFSYNTKEINNKKSESKSIFSTVKTTPTKRFSNKEGILTSYVSSTKPMEKTTKMKGTTSTVRRNEQTKITSTIRSVKYPVTRPGLKQIKTPLITRKKLKKTTTITGTSTESGKSTTFSDLSTETTEKPTFTSTNTESGKSTKFSESSTETTERSTFTEDSLTITESRKSTLPIISTESIEKPSFTSTDTEPKEKTTNIINTKSSATNSESSKNTVPISSTETTEKSTFSGVSIEPTEKTTTNFESTKTFVTSIESSSRPTKWTNSTGTITEPTEVMDDIENTTFSGTSIKSRKSTTDKKGMSMFPVTNTESNNQTNNMEKSDKSYDEAPNVTESMDYEYNTVFENKSTNSPLKDYNPLPTVTNTISEESEFMQNFTKPETSTEFPPILPMSTEKENFILHTESILPQISPTEVMLPEGVTKDILWQCPLGSKWFKLRRYEYPIPISDELVSSNQKSSFLFIQNANGIQDAGRYFCVYFNDSNPSKMQLKMYILLHLPHKWLDIQTASDTTTNPTSSFQLLVEQRATLNCRHGNLLRNNISVTNINCGARITIIGSELTNNSSTITTYSCSAPDLPAVLYQNKTIPSHNRNCSMKLWGCKRAANESMKVKSKELKEEKENEVEVLLAQNIKCSFSYLVATNRSSLVTNVKNHTTYLNKIYVLFYFDSAARQCFPVETTLWMPDIAFTSLDDCLSSCRIVSSKFQQCLAALNIESEANPNPADNSTLFCDWDNQERGRYLATYNIHSRNCHWYYQSPGCPVSINWFRSMSVCIQSCEWMSQERLYTETRKLCGNLDTGWIFNYSSNSCYPSLESSTYNSFRFRSQRQCEAICKYPTTSAVCRSTIWGTDNCAVSLYPSNKTPYTVRFHSVQKNNNGVGTRCIPVLDYKSPRWGSCSMAGNGGINRFPTERGCRLVCGADDTDEPTSKITEDNILATTTLVKVTTAPTTVMEDLSSTTMKTTTTEKPIRLFPEHMVLNIDPCLSELAQSTAESLRLFLNNNSINRGDITNHTRYYYSINVGRCLSMNVSLGRYHIPLSQYNVFDRYSDCDRHCRRRHVTYPSSNRQRCLAGPDSYPDCWPSSISSTSGNDNKKLYRIVYFYDSKIRACSVLLVRPTVKCVQTNYFPTRKECQQNCKIAPPTEVMLQDRCLGELTWTQKFSQEIKINSSSSYKPVTHHFWVFWKRAKQCVKILITSAYKSSDTLIYAGNRFVSYEECQSTCINVDPKSICRLPPDSGVGSRFWLRYHYDFLQAECRTFLYHGSLGNRNRFVSRKECKSVCGKVWPSIPPPKDKYDVMHENKEPYDWLLQYRGPFSVEPQFDTIAESDPCLEPLKFGSCVPGSGVQDAVYIDKYSYDSDRGICTPHTFSGCGASSKNQYDHMVMCERICVARLSLSARPRRCITIPEEVGHASDCHKGKVHTTWRLDFISGRCMPYLSCQKSLLSSQRRCEHYCKAVPAILRYFTDICHLPPVSHEQCDKTRQTYYYYRSGTNSCERSVVCSQEYGNNFPSLDICQKACIPKIHTDQCKLPVDKGPCNDSIPYYYFDWSRQKCRPFSYGGCLGNRNRYLTRNECEKSCGGLQCGQFHSQKHNCRGRPYINITGVFWYDGSINRCVPLRDAVCLHKSDFFSDLSKCQMECQLPNAITDIAYKLQQRFTTADGSFVNNFLLRYKERCLLEVPKRQVQFPVCSKNGKWLPRFYFDLQHKKCRFFYYNGCDGIADRGNRFHSLIKCKAECSVNATVGRGTMGRSVTTLAPAAPAAVAAAEDNRRNEGGNLMLDGRTSNNNNNNNNNKFTIVRCPPVGAEMCRADSISCSTDDDCTVVANKRSVSTVVMVCCQCAQGDTVIGKCRPVFDCRFSRYGCCADGRSVASDSLHTSCVNNSDDSEVSERQQQQCRILTASAVIVPQTDETGYAGQLQLSAAASGDPKPTLVWKHLVTNRKLKVPVELNRVESGWRTLLHLDKAIGHDCGIWEIRCQQQKQTKAHKKNEGKLVIATCDNNEGNATKVSLAVMQGVKLAQFRCPISTIIGQNDATWIWESPNGTRHIVSSEMTSDKIHTTMQNASAVGPYLFMWNVTQSGHQGKWSCNHTTLNYTGTLDIIVLTLSKITSVASETISKSHWLKSNISTTTCQSQGQWYKLIGGSKNRVKTVIYPDKLLFTDQNNNNININNYSSNTIDLKDTVEYVCVERGIVRRHIIVIEHK